MPLLLRSKADRAAVQIAHASAMRSTNELVEQLQTQVRKLQAELRAEREQRMFDAHEFENQIRSLLRDLLDAKYQLAKNN